MRVKLFLLIICGIILTNIDPTAAQSIRNEVYLAYVHDDVVTLADAEGMPLATPGPEFQVSQAANLFWTADGKWLYIARRDGLFQTDADGSPSVRVPGNYGITVLYDRSGIIIYYMETANPQDSDDPDFLTFPLRELNTRISAGGTGRLVGYIGQYPKGSSDAVTYGAALQYARDNGLLVAGRPRIFPTYGSTMFYSCCFPDIGLNTIDLASGNKQPYDPTFIPGPSALNSTYSRLAGPTSNGTIRVYDLITAGTRDYTANVGTIERMAWSLDDDVLYFTSRANPQNPLELNPIVTSPIDTQSASIVVWRLDLSTGQLKQLAVLGDFYGVSSIAVTRDYIFVVAVERNNRLVEDLNTGRLPQDLSTTDPRLISDYLPGTILFRIRPDGSEALSIMADVWGITARQRR